MSNDENRISDLIDGGLIKREETMSNKQLPPELAEKMYLSVDADECAQIAVDYAEQQNNDLIKSNEIDCLFFEKWIQKLELKNWHEDVVQEMKDMLSEKQLLKK